MKTRYLLLALAFTAAPTFAQVVESGDAPDGVGGTQDATGTVATITGDIVPGDFADCYTITIGDVDAFRASTEDAGTGIDSQLWLFTTGLEGIVFNDDTPAGEPGNGTGLESTIPAGALTGLGLSPGTYVLCVSEWDQDAVNVLDEEIFPQSPFDEVHTPNAPSGDYFLDDWNTSAITPGSYVINLEGTAPPAPDFSIAINTHAAPARGTSVFFRGPVTNTGGATGFVYVYFTYSVPGVGTFKRNLGGINLPAGASFNYRDFPNSKNFVPLTPDAPAGMYTVTVYAASDKNGTTIYDTDSFSFTLPPLPYLAETAGLPGAMSLEAVEPGAAPNPFRDATTITYAVMEDAPVDLRVFDVTGREVALLASGTQATGVHSAMLHAGDLPGGVYVWRLTIGGEVTTGRITLAR